MLVKTVKWLCHSENNLTVSCKVKYTLTTQPINPTLSATGVCIYISKWYVHTTPVNTRNIIEVFAIAQSWNNSNVLKLKNGETNCCIFTQQTSSQQWEGANYGHMQYVDDSQMRYGKLKKAHSKALVWRVWLTVNAHSVLNRGWGVAQGIQEWWLVLYFDYCMVIYGR